MIAVQRTIRDIHGDRTGQSMIEWVLLLVGIGIPLIYVFGLLLDALAELYKMVSFIVTLPFP